MEFTKKEQEQLEKAREAKDKAQTRGDINGYELALAVIGMIYETAEARAKAEEQEWEAECEHQQNVKLGIHDDYLERSNY
jgi:hypothetical protein